MQRICERIQRIRLPRTATPRPAAAALVLGAAGLLAGCSLQKDLDVELPAPPDLLVVECYLDGGTNPEASVSELVPYLSTPNLTPPAGVSVSITGPTGRVDNLLYRPGQNRQTRKAYTHRAARTVSISPGDTYRLSVSDTKGRRAAGTATMPSRVPIDTVEYRYNNETGSQRKAYLLVRFRDPAASTDFYRFQVHRRSVNKDPAVDYTPDDRLLNGQTFTLGTGYEFSPNDTLVVTLYHLDPAYARFLESIDDARQANGNPFAQPAAIQNTLSEGLGVFTILSYQRRTVILRP